nr:uncharacterized protein LOC109398820 [Aedes albopictus]
MTTIVPIEPVLYLVQWRMHINTTVNANCFADPQWHSALSDPSLASRWMILRFVAASFARPILVTAPKCCTKVGIRTWLSEIGPSNSRMKEESCSKATGSKSPGRSNQEIQNTKSSLQIFDLDSEPFGCFSYFRSLKLWTAQCTATNIHDRLDKTN